MEGHLSSSTESVGSSILGKSKHRGSHGLLLGEGLTKRSRQMIN